VGCSKRVTNWFVAKSCPSTKEVKGIKINLDFIFNNFSVHRTGLRLVHSIIKSCFFIAENFCSVILVEVGRVNTRQKNLSIK
jgi:hypothetical protein